MKGMVLMPRISASEVMFDGRPLTEVIEDIMGPPRAVTPPTLSDTPPEYTGAPFSLEDQLIGYDQTAMTLTGDAFATDAGEYLGTVELLGRCTWEDGTRDPIPFTWSVARALGSVALSQTEITVSNDAATGYVDATCLGDGAISAVSSQPELVAVTVEENRVTVTGLGRGDVIVTVLSAQSANYEAASAELHVTSSVFAYEPASCTAADVKEAFESGIYKQVFAVGDVFPVEFSGTFNAYLNPTFNTTIGARILGFDHNATYEGAKSIHFALGTVDDKDVALGIGVPMNARNTCDGGWSGSDIRKTTGPEVLNAIEESWRNIITACSKYTSNGNHTKNNTQAEVTMTSDKIWIMSACEMAGEDATDCNPYEHTRQKQYSYYANGASLLRPYYSRSGHIDSTGTRYWTRSPRPYDVYRSEYQYFGCVSEYGNPNAGNTPESQLYIVPCFAIVG